MKVKKSTPNILTPEDKKVLDVVSRYLNSYGMEDGTIRVEMNMPADFEDTDFSHFSFDNNYLVQPPSILIPILNKLRDYIANNKDMEIDVDDLNYLYVEIVIDTKNREIGVYEYWTYYSTDDTDTFDYDEETPEVEDVFNALNEDSSTKKFSYLRLGYSGGGDSGYIEDYFDEGPSVPAVVSDFCYQVLESNFGGWEINEGSQGNFQFNRVEKKIYWNHTNNIEENDSKTLFEEKF